MIRALAVAMLLSGCASIEPKACAGPEWEWATYKAIVERTAPGSTWVELTERERDIFQRVMNSEPPPTGAMYDRIGYFRNPQARQVMLVYMVNDCVWGNGYTLEMGIRMMIHSMGRES